MKNLSLYLPIVIFLSCAEKEKQETNAADHTYRDKAYAYLNESKADSAFFYFNLAEDEYLDSKDSLNLANCLIQMAIILANQGDYFGSQETSLQAGNYLDVNNSKHHYYLGSNFNNLGFSSHRLKDYENALKFYESALRFSTDSASTLLYLNNKAKTYQQLENYIQATEIYERIVNESRGDRQAYARALTNYSVTKWFADSISYDPKSDLLHALHIRLQEKDLLGQNSSYTHLTDYYAKRQPDSALSYARKRYAAALKLKSDDDLTHALQRLIQLGPADSTRYYFERYRRLNDSIQFARATAKNQFALIRYEVEKNKADNLRLQKENAEKAYQLSRQRVWTTAIVMLVIIFLIGGVYWYKKRKQHLELEAQNRIKAHQLKTSRKVHDVVANGLYRIMAEVENKSDIDRESILDRLEDMYEKSRDISYETEALSAKQHDFSVKIAGLLKSFATDSTKVLIAGNAANLWENVNDEAKYEIEHILQELMVNMRKHSHATHVAVRFEQSGNKLYIHYNDNGVGLSKGFAFGNGLTNTGNRIKNLEGLITFDTEIEKGLRIHLSFPVF